MARMTRKERLASIKCICSLLKQYLPEEYNYQPDEYFDCYIIEYKLHNGLLVLANLWFGAKHGYDDTNCWAIDNAYCLSDPNFDIEDLVCDIITCYESSNHLDTPYIPNLFLTP